VWALINSRARAGERNTTWYLSTFPQSNSCGVQITVERWIPNCS
jgi:hypothetical protein